MAAGRVTSTSPRRVDSLDGVRALAVLLVVAFHVSVPGAAGGFLGVDVFFVLSGFLITTLLIKELGTTGRIDLGRFWARRALRLLPAALLVVVAVCLWSLFAAPEFRRPDIGTDALWAVGYLANWRFIDSASYFSSDGSASPLLHMWSLAVEEQFYLVWPLVLSVLGAAVWSRMKVPHLPDSASRMEFERRRKVAVAVGVGALALTLAALSGVLLWWLHEPSAPERAYMGTDTKIVEPLIGAVAASLMTRPRVQTFVVRHHHLLMGAGLLGVGAGVARLAGPSPLYFSGGAVVFSLVCAVLVAAVTAGGNSDLVARTLGWGPLAHIGRISYGIYLWHWPVALWVVGEPGTFRPAEASMAVVLTIAVALASYHFVETPIRRGALGRLRPTVLVPAVAMSMAATAAVALVLTGVLPGRPSTATAGESTDASAVVVVGDSVASRLMPALAAEGERRGLTVLKAARGGCPALPVPALDGDGTLLADGACTTTVPRVQDETIDRTHPGTVVIWSRYELADRLADDGRVLRAGTPEFWQAQKAALTASVDRWAAHGATVVLVQTDRPGIGLASRCTDDKCHPFIRRLWHEDRLRATWNAILTETATRDPRVRTVAIDDAFCRDTASPCNDALPLPGEGQAAAAAPTATPTKGRLARPDGSHFDPVVAPTVARVLLDRITAAVR